MQRCGHEGREACLSTPHKTGVAAREPHSPLQRCHARRTSVRATAAHCGASLSARTVDCPAQLGGARWVQAADDGITQVCAVTISIAPRTLVTVHTIVMPLCIVMRIARAAFVSRGPKKAIMAHSVRRNTVEPYGRHVFILTNVKAPQWGPKPALEDPYVRVALCITWRTRPLLRAAISHTNCKRSQLHRTAYLRP